MVTYLHVEFKKKETNRIKSNKKNTKDKSVIYKGYCYIRACSKGVLIIN